MNVIKRFVGAALASLMIMSSAAMTLARNFDDVKEDIEDEDYSDIDFETPDAEDEEA